MCGRFGLFVTPEVLEEYFSLTDFTAALAPPPRYNLTPGQAVAVVREHDGRRRLDALQWGLIPFWAKDASDRPPAHQRAARQRRLEARVPRGLERRRCLIPASGFYEWSEPKGGRKRPYFIRAANEPLLALAGLWERWRTPSGDKLETCVIVTTDANAQLMPIHDRMPLLIPRDAQAIWLDPRTSVEAVLKLATDPPALAAYGVGLAVNDPRNDDETLVAPADEAAG